MSHQPMRLAPFQRASAGSTAFRAAVSLAFVVALGVVAFPAAAALYKWTDANGRVVYSDQPPNGNFKVEAINAPPPPANPNAVKELATKEAELQQKKMLRADEEAKAAKTQGRNGQEARAVRESARPARDDAVRPEQRSCTSAPTKRASPSSWTTRRAGRSASSSRGG